MPVALWRRRRAPAAAAPFAPGALASGLPRSWRVRLLPLPRVLQVAGLLLAVVALARPARREMLPLRTEGIDILHAHFFYANGVEAVVTGGWHNRGEYPFSMEFTATFEQDTMEFSSASKVGMLQSPSNSGYQAEILHFTEACNEGKQPPLCPPRESADAIKLTHLAIEARKQKGEKVPCNI